MSEISKDPVPLNVSYMQIALTFNQIALSSFGGGLNSFARIVLVDRKAWLTDDEFLEALSVCQILPGPNTVNMAVFIGSRLRGWRGAIAAFFGLITIPLIIVLAAGVAYFQSRDIPSVRAALGGLAAAAVGLVFGMSIKLASKHFRDPLFVLFGGTTFMLVGVFRFSMIPVLLLLIPIAWWAFSRRDKKAPSA